MLSSKTVICSFLRILYISPLVFFFFFCNTYSVLKIVCFALDTRILSLLVLSGFILSLSSATCIISHAIHVLSATGLRAVESARK